MYSDASLLMQCGGPSSSSSLPSIPSVLAAARAAPTVLHHSHTQHQHRLLSVSAFRKVESMAGGGEQSEVAGVLTPSAVAVAVQSVGRHIDCSSSSSSCFSAVLGASTPRGSCPSRTSRAGSGSSKSNISSLKSGGLDPAASGVALGEMGVDANNNIIHNGIAHPYHHRQSAVTPAAAPALVSLPSSSSSRQQHQQQALGCDAPNRPTHHQRHQEGNASHRRNASGGSSGRSRSSRSRSESASAAFPQATTSAFVAVTTAKEGGGCRGVANNISVSPAAPSSSSPSPPSRQSAAAVVVASPLLLSPDGGAVGRGGSGGASSSSILSPREGSSTMSERRGRSGGPSPSVTTPTPAAGVAAAAVGGSREKKKRAHSSSSPSPSPSSAAAAAGRHSASLVSTVGRFTVTRLRHRMKAAPAHVALSFRSDLRREQQVREIMSIRATKKYEKSYADWQSTCTSQENHSKFLTVLIWEAYRYNRGEYLKVEAMIAGKMAGCQRDCALPAERRDEFEAHRSAARARSRDQISTALRQQLAQRQQLYYQSAVSEREEGFAAARGERKRARSSERRGEWIAAQQAQFQLQQHSQQLQQQNGLCSNRGGREEEDADADADGGEEDNNNNTRTLTISHHHLSPLQHSMTYAHCTGGSITACTTSNTNHPPTANSTLTTAHSDHVGISGSGRSSGEDEDGEENNTTRADISMTVASPAVLLANSKMKTRHNKSGNGNGSSKSSPLTRGRHALEMLMPFGNHPNAGHGIVGGNATDGATPTGDCCVSDVAHNANVDPTNMAANCSVHSAAATDVHSSSASASVGGRCCGLTTGTATTEPSSSRCSSTTSKVTNPPTIVIRRKAGGGPAVVHAKARAPLQARPAEDEEEEEEGGEVAERGGGHHKRSPSSSTCSKAAAGSLSTTPTPAKPLPLPSSGDGISFIALASELARATADRSSAIGTPASTGAQHPSSSSSATLAGSGCSSNPPSFSPHEETSGALSATAAATTSTNHINHTIAALAAQMHFPDSNEDAAAEAALAAREREELTFEALFQCDETFRTGVQAMHTEFRSQLQSQFEYAESHLAGEERTYAAALLRQEDRCRTDMHRLAAQREGLQRQWHCFIGDLKSGLGKARNVMQCSNGDIYPATLQEFRQFQLFARDWVAVANAALMVAMGGLGGDSSSTSSTPVTSAAGSVGGSPAPASAALPASLGARASPRMLSSAIGAAGGVVMGTMLNTDAAGMRKRELIVE